MRSQELANIASSIVTIMLLHLRCCCVIADPLKFSLKPGTVHYSQRFVTSTDISTKTKKALQPVRYSEVLL